MRKMRNKIREEKNIKIVNENWRKFYKELEKEFGEDIGDLFYLLYKEIEKDNNRKERVISMEIIDILRYFRKRYNF